MAQAQEPSAAEENRVWEAGRETQCSASLLSRRAFQRRGGMVPARGMRAATTWTVEVS